MDRLANYHLPCSAQKISEKLDEDARMIWGAQISDDLQGSIRVMLVVTGVKSPQIMGGYGPEGSDSKRKEVESELGITFVD